MKRTQHQFPLFENFKSIVDRALSWPSWYKDDIEVQYTEAYAEIKEVFVEESSQPVNDLEVDRLDELGAILKEITYAHVLFGINLDPYYSAADTLRDATSQIRSLPLVSPADRLWFAAVRIALSFNRLRAPKNSHNSRPQLRHISFAYAVRYFIDRGINIPLIGNAVAIEKQDVWKAVVGAYLQPLGTFGGIRAMQLITNNLELRYEPLVRRVRLHPTPDMMGHKMDRTLPCGLLYRAALKVLHKKCTVHPSEKVAKDILQAATNFAALYDVEPFTVYEVMHFPRPEQLLTHLRDIVLYDELFSIPQCHPEVMGQLLGHLFIGLEDASLKDKLGWSISDMFQLWHTLLNFSKHDVRPVFVNKEVLFVTLSKKVGATTTEALLSAFLIKDPNSSYWFPTNASSGDVRECVLAPAQHNQIWIPAALFLGQAFYTRLLSLLIKVSPNIGSTIGRNFEKGMINRIREMGIRCWSGDLGNKKRRFGDADFIIETDDTIALFELKKKGLRRETMSGHDLQLLVDLSQGLIHGMNQLAKQEIELIRKGFLPFVDGRKLNWNNRRIIKIVVSLTDYGGLHETSLTHQILRVLCGVKLSAVRDITQRQIEALEDANESFRMSKVLYDEYQALHPTWSPKDRDLFDHTLFHNVFFIEHLLSKKLDASSFLKALLVGGRMVTGSRDAFFDHNQFQH